MDVKNLISRLSEESKNLPNVIAPVLTRKGFVGVTINSHPYRLQVEVTSPGWYVLKPTSSVEAKVVKEAAPFQKRECLGAAMGLRTIAMRRVSESRWFVFPFNTSDAKSKDIDPSPLEVFLVDRNLEPFSVIQTRLWGDRLVFDSYLVPPVREYSESIEKGQTNPPEVKGIGPEFKIVYSLLQEEVEKAKQRTIEGRIKSAVEYLGGELVGFSEFGDGYTFEYRDGRNTYRTQVSQNLRLISAGICLSHLEHQQTLASTVAVMRQRGRGYYDDWDNDDDD